MPLTRSMKSLIALAGAAMLAFGPSAHAALPMYSIVVLPPHRSSGDFEPRAINNHGLVAGMQLTNSPGTGGYFWTPPTYDRTQFTDSTTVIHINDDGVVAGATA